MKQWRLEWKHESGEWRAQIQTDDRAKFDEAVSETVKTSEREGGWMRGTEWRIAEYELSPVSMTSFVPNADLTGNVKPGKEVEYE